ncbi:MAG: ASKHA domain-containing protein [Treponema sp.]|nr:ASKHA domain-containing protein [Treponema sp.]
MDTFGIGLDLGTTTIHAQLVNIKKAEVIDTFSAFNNQREFGADVISRISAAQNGKLNELFNAVNNQIESILQHFIQKYSLPAIDQCVVSGNTTMLHLFCRADPSAMGHSPYRPVFLEERSFAGSELSLSVKNITLLPGISAFIGADVTAGLAFTDITNRGEDSLFVDIGTNGEIAAWKETEKSLFCCSTAAGPCFEEAEISCGLNAANFIDAIAEMKRNEIIDKTGALKEKYAQTGFPVTDKNIITQKDVRQFQLAKSAIYSGIKLLCKTASLELGKIGAAYIAGGLGYYLNFDNAALTGLLPHELTGKETKIKTEVCGNTSLKGAVKYLFDPSFITGCKDIISHAKTIDLANDKYFTAAFTHNLWFQEN